MNSVRTHVRRTDVQRAVKSLFHFATGLVPNARTVADDLDENVSSVEAWRNTERANQPPLWVLGHPALPRVVRNALLAGLDELAGVSTRGGASPEEHTTVVQGSMGCVLAAMAQALIDKSYSRAEALELLPLVLRHREHIDHLVGLLQQRAGVVPEQGRA